MASDRQQYREALREWDSLRAVGAFSSPPELGCVAIICSLHEVEAEPGSEASAYVTENDPEIFRAEAFAIADELMAVGRQPFVAINASPDDFSDVLTDPSFSDVIVIGHGDLSGVAMDNPDNRDAFDWKDVARTADHLKKGQFVQRHCGKHTRALSVPLGLFAVSDHRSVIAPAGEYFAPTDLHHPHNSLLRSVSQALRMSYKQVKARFPYQPGTSWEDDD